MSIWQDPQFKLRKRDGKRVSINLGGAFCLDGTAPGYYIRPGVGEDARKFKLHFKGGGWCMSDEDCTYGRSQGWLGSSMRSQDSHELSEHY